MESESASAHNRFTSSENGSIQSSKHSRSERVIPAKKVTQFQEYQDSELSQNAPAGQSVSWRKAFFAHAAFVSGFSRTGPIQIDTITGAVALTDGMLGKI